MHLTLNIKLNAALIIINSTGIVLNYITWNNYSSVLHCSTVQCSIVQSISNTIYTKILAEPGYINSLHVQNSPSITKETHPLIPGWKNKKQSTRWKITFLENWNLLAIESFQKIIQNRKNSNSTKCTASCSHMATFNRNWYYPDQEKDNNAMPFLAVTLNKKIPWTKLKDFITA